MQQRATPFFLLLVGVLTLFQIPGLRPGAAAPPKAPAPAQETPEAPAATGTKEVAGEQEHDWQEPLRLYREFFGISTPPPAKDTLTVDEHPAPGSKAEDAANDWQEVKDAAGSHYKMSFLIALVPDPIDSSLAALSDQALSAIQQGYTVNDFLLDRHWLPWLDEAAQSRRYRQVPGVLLFRSSAPIEKFDNQLETVLLVGETPKFGIHKQAFQNALGLIARLAPGETVRIAGPTFSGSAESLRLALEGTGLPDVRIVTGSATSPEVKEVLGSVPGARFSRTVVPDDVLLARALCYLVEELGWPTTKVALLTESDTQYGRKPKRDPSSDPGCPGTHPIDLVRVYFPSGLASVRTEHEHTEGKKGDEAQPVLLPRATLNLSLAERAQPADIVRQLSPLSTHSKDLAISNLLTKLRDDDILYLGLLATDVRDKLYLARRIRTFNPDVTLFSLNNDLLFAHPQYREEMNGMLVLSSYPLFTEGGLDDDYRRQFSSEVEQGLFQAVDLLVRRDGKVEARARAGEEVWIAAVGNGSLWPVAHLQAKEKEQAPAKRLSALARKKAADPGHGIGDRFRDFLRGLLAFLATRPDFGVLVLLGFLLLLAVWLGNAAPPRGLAAGNSTARSLVGFGLASLWLMGGALLVVGTLPAAVRYTFQLPLVLLLVGVFGVATAWAALPSQRVHPRRATQVALLGACLLGVAVLTGALHWLWMPGGEQGAQFFQLRARRFSSGLSPLVSVLCLGFASYAWALLQLKRRKLIERQDVSWPINQPCEPQLLGCEEMSEPLKRRLERTLPPAQSRFWWVLAGVLLPSALFLAAKAQPVVERRVYGWLFLAAVLLGLTLCAVSFYQFIRLWLTLEKVLERLDHSHLVKTLCRLAEEIDWKPMRSFGWQTPSFRMLVLSAAKLNAIYELPAFPVSVVPGTPVRQPRDLAGLLNAMFKANQEGNLRREINARRELNQIFTEACRDLASPSPGPAVQEFLAVRLVAYIRPVISHLRNCLMATMASGLFLLAAVQTYSFQPKRFVSLGILGVLVLAVVVTLWAFLQMDRNTTLSAIGGTAPGKVTFDRPFFLNVLTYGAIPLLGVVATQFPSVGQEILGWVNPLLRVVGSS
jgi:hypothetical protein